MLILVFFQDTLSTSPKDYITEMDVFHDPYKVYTHRCVAKFEHLLILERNMHKRNQYLIPFCLLLQLPGSGIDVWQVPDYGRKGR